MTAALGLIPDNLAPRRPVLRWHGGKWRLAPWIIDQFPPHRCYVESFGGAGSVLLRKPRAYAEVYNDLDDEVVGLFRVLRDPAMAARLTALLELTPFARAEFDQSYEPIDEPVERARRLLVRAAMGFGSNAHSSSPVAAKNGFKAHTRATAVSVGFRSDSTRAGGTPATNWATYPEALGAIVSRLRHVIVEHRDAVTVMVQHDTPDTLHYVDPPYQHELRAAGNGYDLRYRLYRHELDRTGHEALLAVLVGLRGMVVLSGYPSPIYDDALPGWARIEMATHADGARPRTEVLWINPVCAARRRAQALPLFGPQELRP